nr:hypothetical protein [Tanacetum cinerariifolium]
MNENANTSKKLFKFKRNKKRQGPKVQLHERLKRRASSVKIPKSNRFKHDLPFKPRWGNDPGKLRATPDLLIRDCFCSKGSVDDKILVPKPPENYARCAKCGHPFNGPYCQGCTYLREKLEEDLVTYFQKFLNTSESSDGSTNVVNAPREPFVVKQDHGINPPHIDECCCDCGEALDGIVCQRCTSLDGIICQRCTCKSCGKGAHICYNCPPTVPIISNPEPCNPTMNNEPPQTLPSFDSTCYSDKEISVPCVSKPNFVDESSNIFIPPPQPPIYSCEFYGSNAQYGHYCIPQAPFINQKPGYSKDFNFPQNIHNFQQQGPHKNFQCQPLNYCEPNPIYDPNYSGFDQIGDLHPQQHLCCDNCGGLHETSKCQPMSQNFYNFNSSSFDQTQPPQFPVVHPPPQETSIEISHDQENFINSLSWNRPTVYDDDDDDVDYTIEITPVLYTEEPDNSLTFKDNPTPSFEFLTKSSSTSPKSVLEETTTFHNSLPEFVNFCFDLEEISSGSTTTHSDISLSEYEAFSFYDDHIEEIRSGSTTTQSDISLPEYDSFIFDLSNDQK